MDNLASSRNTNTCSLGQLVTMIDSQQLSDGDPCPGLLLRSLVKENILMYVIILDSTIRSDCVFVLYPGEKKSTK